ncbi:MAG: flagellar hook protein FlgE [Burkholderiaceae bacterium]
MSFQQGLSGLNAAARNLEVIGNNVANSGTVGFKLGQAQFADMYANSMNGAGASVAGIGVTVTNVSQQFTQGNISSSNNPLDVAIKGGGFFRMVSNGTVMYGRNGQFQLDDKGYIVNPSQGYARLTGYGTVLNTATGLPILDTGKLVDIHIDTADIPPRPSTGGSMVLTLDSRATVLDPANFDMNDPATYAWSTPLPIYDSLGNVHSLQTYYVKTGPVPPATGNGEWAMFASLDGVPVGYTPPAAPVPIGTFEFTTDGVLVPDAPGTPPLRALRSFTLDIGGGATSPQTVAVDFIGTTQYGSAFGSSAATQNGYASGRLSGFDIGPDGSLLGKYTNGQTWLLGQVTLTNFANPNGLQPLGNNLWGETVASGVPLTGAPNTGTLGTLQSNAVEDSNVDLTAELVNMITAQRAYQANAQTIKTQDQIMQTLTNLR